MDREGEDALAATAASDAAAPRADLATLDPEAATTSVARAPGLRPADPGRYRREGEVARGGLGRIVRARDLNLDRTVAIKEVLGPGEGEYRFVREALLTARLEHPSIVPVHDAGCDEQGRPFYAMKLVRGRAMNDVLADATTRAQRLALVPTVLAVADAIAYAHSEGVIHRDLKPGNVLVGAYGETVVIDWGLAKDLRASEPDQAGGRAAAIVGDATLDGAVLGTPAYMAPEQAGGAATDERTDVYALGAMLYEVLQGRPPHRGGSLDVVLRRILSGDIEALGADVPPDLAAIVVQAMQVDPDRRYRHAGALADDLRRYVTGQLVGVYRYSRRERVARWIRRHRGAVAVGGAAAIALAIIGTISIRQVLAEREEARAARAVAETREGEARDAQRAATDRADELVVATAARWLREDATAAVAALAALAADSPRWRHARPILAEARERGVAELVATQLRDDSYVALDRDATRVAAVVDGEVTVWDRASRVVRRFAIPAGCDGSSCDDARYSVTLSSDGRRVGVTSERQVLVWDVDATMALPRALAGDGVRLRDDGDLLVTRLAADELSTTTLIRIARDGGEEVLMAGMHRVEVARDGRLAVGSAPGRLVGWLDGAHHERAIGEGEEIVAVALAPAGARAAWVDERDQVIVWDVGAAAPRVVDASGHRVHLAFPQGDQLALHQASRLRIVDVRTGALVVDTPSALDVAFEIAGDPPVLAGDGLARWQNGRERALLSDGRIARLAATADGALVASRAFEIRIWHRAEVTGGSIARPDEGRPPQPGVPRVRSGFTTASNAAGSHVLVDWRPGRVEVWARDGVTLRRVAELPAARADGLALAPDGQRVAGWQEGAVRVWSLDGSHRDLAPIDGEPRLLWFDAAGALHAATATEAGMVVTRWDADGRGGDVVCAAIATWRGATVSRDGSTLIRHDGIERCRVATGAIDTLPGLERLAAVAVSADGARVVGIDRARGELVVLGRGVPRTVAVAPGLGEPAFTIDGTAVVALHDGGLLVWSPEDGSVRTVAIPADPIRAFTPGRDGRVVVTTSSGLRLLDLQTGASRLLDDPSSDAHRIFDDGTVLVAGSGGMELWLDDLPFDPAALHALATAMTNARLDGHGNLALAAPYVEP